MAMSLQYIVARKSSKKAVSSVSQNGSYKKIYQDNKQIKHYTTRSKNEKKHTKPIHFSQNYTPSLD